jgi:hypothetical protein
MSAARSDSTPLSVQQGQKRRASHWACPFFISGYNLKNKYYSFEDLGNMLVLHPSAAIEYWYFKLNVGKMALLVDWIARRRSNEHILRASIHSSYKREVVFENLPSFVTDTNFLQSDCTKGQIGEIAWDLSIDLQNKWIYPDIYPSRLSNMLDSVLDSAPLARFSGWIRHGKEEVRFENVTGMVSLYWGRSLNQDWWWLSANQFEQEGFAVEAAVAHSRLWGLPLTMPFSYFYLRQPHQDALTVLPLGLVRAKGNPDSFEITVPRLAAAPIRLLGKGREYGDLGDRIMNTLVGDLQIWEGEKLLAEAKGTACLERRHPSS